jgi:REP-associated tyrosine transposase
VISYIKGKSAIAVARQFGGRQRNFNGEQFWARGLQFQRLDLRRNKFGAASGISLMLRGTDEDGEF